MIRIASLVPYKFIPAIKGGEKAIYYFLQYLSKYATISCFTVEENCLSEKENFTPVSLGSTRNKWRYVNPALLFTLKKELKKRELKHLIIEHPYYGWLGFLLKKMTGAKLIIRSHNIESNRFKTMKKWWWRVLYYYEKFTHRIADLNLFITEEDKNFAINTFHVSPEKSIVITYGIENNKTVTIEEKMIVKKKVCEELALPLSTILILFNGTLDYGPNREGLDLILKNINPLLINKINQFYKIIICGLRLPEVYNDLKAYSSQNIIYKGFVDDIDLYFKAADLFVNPIVDGGGIKTKLVEALATNTPSVSFATGAFGVPASITGNHLKIIADRDFEAFANAIVETSLEKKDNIPHSFFEHFSWDRIAKKAISEIERLK